MRKISIFTWIQLAFLGLALIVLLSTTFVLAHRTVSNIFIALSAFFLLIILVQWFGLKKLNSDVRLDRIRVRSIDRKTVEYFLPTALPIDPEAPLSKTIVVEARRRRNYIIITAALIPALSSIVIAIILAYV